MSIVTSIAPVNIAVIKYWGKRDEHLILPLNDSVSATLNTDEMQAKTTVMTSPKLKENKIWLNGKEESFDNPRLISCLKEIKKRAQGSAQKTGAGDDQNEWKVHICSENNFPTAAGLASSAAGYACLVYALAQLYGVKGDVSSIARLGSGSACRSVIGGFVRWHRGQLDDGSDSLAEQIVPASHWPNMRILILVVNDNKKKMSSTKGMKLSVETSELLKHRVSHCVPERTQKIIKAIETQDFETFAEVTMKDSNQFHSVCLDTFPPAVYMNDVSHAVVDFVHCYNKKKGQTKVAYTFDAGPNACLFLLEENVQEVLSLIKHTFPPSSDKDFIRGIPVKLNPVQQDLNVEPYENGLLKYIIHTKIGEGPKVLTDENDHLLTADGSPRKQT